MKIHTRNKSLRKELFNHFHVRCKNDILVWVAFVLSLSLSMSISFFLADFSQAESRLDCPEPRFTKRAPDEFYQMVNPLASIPDNIKKGKILYQRKAKPMPCKQCHGIKGDGRGPMGKRFKPPPRNFTCAETIKGVSDGQLFWIIKNGSRGTDMMPYKSLKDEQIWQLILYLRKLAE